MFEKRNIFHIMENFDFPNEWYAGEITIPFNRFLYIYHFNSHYYGLILLNNIFNNRMLSLKLCTSDKDEIFCDYTSSFVIYDEEVINIKLFKLRERRTLKI